MLCFDKLTCERNNKNTLKLFHFVKINVIYHLLITKETRMLEYGGRRLFFTSAK